MPEPPAPRFTCTVRPDPADDAGEASTPPRPNALPIGRRPSVEVSFEVRATKPVLLEMVARGNRALPVGCRGGGCGVCRVRVLAGDFETQQMSRRHVTEDEEADGFALSCRLLARSDLVVIAAPKPVGGRPAAAAGGGN